MSGVHGENVTRGTCGTRLDDAAFIADSHVDDCGCVVERADASCLAYRTWGALRPPYTTIMADPPWAQRRKGNIAPTRIGRVLKDRGITAQYDTLTPAEVANLPVGDLAAPDAHLYLWTPNLDLPDAFAVMAAWGFRYITAVTWVKTGHLGLGYHFRTMTEHMLFGVRGKLRTQDRGLRNHFTAPKAGHSVKPDAAYEFVEQASPGPYLDLFSRRVREDWDGWGNQYPARMEARDA